VVQIATSAPACAAHIDPDGASWAEYMDLWLLSFELGLANRTRLSSN
jgi:hypothetical protein